MRHLQNAVPLCIALVFMLLPIPCMATSMVDSGNCLACHTVGTVGGSEGLHGSHSSCDSCHDGTPAAGNVSASACIECHPSGDNGLCPLVAVHGTSCTSCHSSCAGEVPDGTSPCVAESLYGAQSEEADLLRNYRDEVLSKSVAGRSIIRIYYALSDVIEQQVQQNRKFAVLLRAMIDRTLPFLTADKQ